MSRLASQAAAGFFPTPPRVTEALHRLLTAMAAGPRRVVRVLDPCAGTGEPAAALARALGGESYGIEINAERAELCRSKLDHVLATSAFTTRLANGAFSLCLLNSPYDADDEKRRLEHAFLTGLSRALCPGGVLLFLIPQVRLGVSARYLAAITPAFAPIASLIPSTVPSSRWCCSLPRRRSQRSIPRRRHAWRRGAVRIFHPYRTNQRLRPSACPRFPARRFSSPPSPSTRRSPPERPGGAESGPSPPSPSSSGHPRNTSFGP